MVCAPGPPCRPRPRVNRLPGRSGRKARGLDHLERPRRDRPALLRGYAARPHGSRIARHFRRQQHRRARRLGAEVPGIEAGAWYGHDRLLSDRSSGARVVCKWSPGWTGGTRRAIAPVSPTTSIRLVAKAPGPGVSLDAPAPEQAAAVVMQLYLSNAPQGTVWWDDISLEQIPDSGSAADHRGVDQSQAQRHEVGGGERAAVPEDDRSHSRAAKTDVILLSGRHHGSRQRQAVRRSRREHPGPTTATLAEVAREAFVLCGGGHLRKGGPCRLQHRGAAEPRGRGSRASTAKCICRARRLSADSRRAATIRCSKPISGRSA